MTLDTPPADSLQWSSCVYRRLVTSPKYPHVIITILSHELGQGTGRNWCTYRGKKKKRSTSKSWSVIEQTKWRPAWGVRTVYNECKKNPYVEWSDSYKLFRNVKKPGHHTDREKQTFEAGVDRRKLQVRQDQPQRSPTEPAPKGRAA